MGSGNEHKEFSTFGGGDGPRSLKSNGRVGGSQTSLRGGDHDDLGLFVSKELKTAAGNIYVLFEYLLVTS